MTKYRVYFQRTTTVTLHMDVEADNAAEAVVKANKATEENDDSLVEMPETYEFDCGPTGEVGVLDTGAVELMDE